ncbi:hypothetical protein HIM_10262 [Hirsutella minnesotensis 3608]|uniref:C2H2-type domain-containing protein n=1 Tax=Hirsutella minnesotensis 3608 TaxID=1043627 RepID=A0A0F7ZRW7_9HYPO|nr:hypothetical protein HIM_10262 [Hirsutella minnesotensis 3608]
MDPFIHLPRFPIVICKTCGYACVADEVAGHLQARHRILPVAERRAVEHTVKSIPGIVHRRDELSRLEVPPPAIQPIPHLAPPKTDGLRCRKCSYVSRHLQKIQAHCRSAPDWQNPRNRGRPTRNGDVQPDKAWKEGVRCQRFFVSGSGSGWFEVGRTAAHRANAAAISRSSLSGSAAATATLTPDVVGHLKTVLQRERRYNTVEQQPRIAAKALGDNSFANVGPWLDYTQWHAMFRGHRRDVLRALSRLPHPPSHMAAIWDHPVWNAIDSSKAIWPTELQKDDGKWGRVPSNIQPPEDRRGNHVDHEEPFEGNSSDSSSESDEDAVNFEEEDFNTLEDTDSNERPSNLDISPATTVGSRLCAQAPVSKTVIETAEGFLESLFQMNLSLCTEPLTAGRIGSTLILRFGGVLGFSRDYHQFLLARQYCPQLSPLIYTQNLLFLEYALPAHSYSTLNIPQRPHAGQLDRLNYIRERYMIFGAQSSLAELVNLRNVGRKAARTEPPVFLLRWSDNGDTVYYGEKFSLKIDDFPKLAEHFISNAERLVTKLMFGMSLDVDLAKAKDDLANTECGYSFVKHPSNGLERAYEELLVRTCTMRTAGLARSGQWRWSAISSYLKDVSMLEEMMLGGLYTACGQMPRVRELLTLQAENSPSSSCGIRIWNGSLIYVIRHHKAKRQTNQEFYVVRFLPVRLGIVVFQYLVCVRRLAFLLRRERLGEYEGSSFIQRNRFLFQSDEKVWEPSRLAIVLQQATLEVWGVKVHAQLYRQVAIGITEKHVREVHVPFNRYDDSSTHADLNVAFAWQSGHRPLQRGITYGLDGAFPHQLQPALLRAYEWASVKWHEFIRQPSKSPPKVRNPLGAIDPNTVPLKRPALLALEHESSTADVKIPVKRRKTQSTDTPTSQQPNAISQRRQADAFYGDIWSDLRTQGDVPRFREKLGDLLCVLPEHRILLCLICRAGLKPGKGIETHFRRRHGQKGDTLRSILSFCSGRSFEDPESVVLPRNGSRPIPELRTYNGYRCSDCGHLTMGRSNMSTHWTAAKHVAKSEKCDRWPKVLLQSFGSCNRLARYWVVSEEV